MLAQPRLEPRALALEPSRTRIGTWGLKPDGCAFAVQAEFVACSAGAPGEMLLILSDSGSDELLCPVDIADRVAGEPLAYPLNIRDVSGKILNVYGTRRVQVLFDGSIEAFIPFHRRRWHSPDR